MPTRARLLTLVVLFIGGLVRADELLLPDDAGAVNVKAPPFNAQGDGITDDTAAVQSAIRDALNRSGRYSKPPFIYLPAGTYLVSDTLEERIGTGGWSDGWRAGLILVGENDTATIIQLADNAPGFDDPTAPKPVIKTGSEGNYNPNPNGTGNQAFRHYIQNLTVDTGSGNPGTIGIDFLANNRGAVEKVTIRSGDGQGVSGLSMVRSWPGPALVKNVTIQGFDSGIEVSQFEYSMTFEHIALVGQNVVGIRNSNNVLNIRDLVSFNSVPAIQATSVYGHIVLLDGTFIGGSADTTAFVNGPGTLYARNIAADGYGYTITSSNPERPAVALAGHVDEFSSHDVRSLFPSPSSSLKLPIQETPEYNTTDLTLWASVVAYGATPDDGSDDDADGIQAAIDSGLPLVYLPNGNYEVGRTLVLRGDVRKITGLESSISKNPSFPSGDPLIRFEGGNPEAAVVEHLRLGGAIEHASPRALSIRHTDIAGCYNTEEGTGPLFIEDVIGKPYHIDHSQNVWARQLNAEGGTEPLVVSTGGNLWLMGMKTEGQQTIIATIGGVTELLGALLYPLNNVPPEIPAFVNDGGSVSLSYAISNYRPVAYPTQVRERRGDEWRELLRGDVPSRGYGSNAALYCGYAAPTKRSGESWPVKRNPE